MRNTAQGDLYFFIAVKKTEFFWLISSLFSLIVNLIVNLGVVLHIVQFARVLIIVGVYPHIVNHIAVIRA